MLLLKFFCIFVVLYLKILNISCEGSGLAFAIDNTRSMGKFLDEIKNVAVAIMKTVLLEKSTEIENFVLITINDPDVVIANKTSSSRTFRSDINRIHIYNNFLNNECEENSLSGVEKAIKASGTGSYIFVFTDAYAKDYTKVNTVKNWCQKKQNRVIFVLTGDCGHPSDRRYTVYHDVAAACSGQVFRVARGHIGTVVEPINMFLKRKHSIIKWIKKPRSDMYTNVPFKIDDNIDYALVSVTGVRAKLRISSIEHMYGPGPESQTIMRNDYGKFIKVNNLQPGTYYAWVKGKSVTSLMIYAPTDFKFDYGFATFKPHTMQDTFKQPTAGRRYHLSIDVTDPDHSVNVKSVQILDMQQDVKMELPLSNILNNFYFTDDFVSPSYVFRIKVIGEIKKTSQPITKKSNTIAPKIVLTVPDVQINEGVKQDVHYGARVSITCIVNAYPPPTIEWLDADGTSLLSQIFETVEEQYIVNLGLKYIKNNETFVCQATNTEGTGTKQTLVAIQPVFNAVNRPAANTHAKYGDDLKIPCNIKSYLPIQIKWFRSGRELSNIDKLSISADGSELTLQSMDLTMQGQYTCEASLISDPMEKQTYDTEVTIPGLTRPFINSKYRKHYVKKNVIEAELSCKTTSGYPKPRVQWYKKSNGSEFELIPRESSEVLTVARALFTPAGQYKCVAENDLGTDSAEFDVIPESEPDVNIDEGAYLYVNYGAAVTLTCRVSAHPPPKIRWFRIDGSSLPYETIKTVEPSYMSYLNLLNIKKNETFVCESANTEGRITKKIQVNVRPVFNVLAVPAANTIAKYDEDVKMQCSIKSYLPIQIKWFQSGRELSNTDKFSISADGSELTLQSMDLAMQGTYTCEAFLLSDPIEKQTHDTEVTIPGLTGPVIESNDKKIYVKRGDHKFNISCKTASGYPKPRVQWYKKNGSEFELIPRESSEVLTVARALFTPAGQYKCVAENDLGSDSAEFVVIPEGEPEVHIVEGVNLNVDYGAEVSLTCNVAAHPRPTVEWLLTGGIVSQPSETTIIEEPLYTSKLQLKNIKKNETYICKATNTEGTSTRQTRVDVRPVFSAMAVPAGKTSANYGEDVKILCSIKSYLPIQVKWFRSGNNLRNTDKLSIAADGSELTLQSMDLAMQGKYTCEASLISDPMEKQTYDTEVTIPGLMRPVIEVKNGNLYVKKNENETELSCRTASGYPKPRVQWYKKNGNAFELIPHQSSEVLTVARALFTPAGQYKCVAENDLGSDSAEFVVIPEGEPDVHIVEGVSLNVDYGAEVSLTCNVAAHPRPTVEWLLAGGIVSQPFETTVLEKPLYTSKLKLENIKKNETYICKATNTEGTSTTQTRVDVRPVFNAITVPAAITTATYNGDVKVQCIVKSYLPIQIKWFRSGRELRNTDKLSIAADGSELTLQSMDLATQGKYTCEASLISDPTEKQTHDTDVQIAGLVYPEVTCIENQTVLSGNNVTAICRVKGVPKPTISWQFKPKNSEQFSTLPGSNEELNMPDIKLHHFGAYKCTAKNVLGQTEREFNIVVEERPTITNEESIYFGVEGDLVLQIPCNVTGFPEPTFVWKEGVKTIGNDSKFLVTDNVLYIKNPVISDTRTITCEATNKLGTAIATFNTEVTDIFEGDENFYGETHEVSVENGKPVTITCALVNSQTDSVRWYKNGLHSKQTGSTYVIGKANLQYGGNYTCRVNTLYGSQSETYVLDVGTAPDFNNVHSSPLITEWKYEDQKLDCTANSKPESKIEWSHDGVKLNSSYNVYEMTITDWGEYTCRVSNVHGSINRTFKVTSSGCYLRNIAQRPNMPLITDLSGIDMQISINNVDLMLTQDYEIKFLCPNDTKTSNAFQIFSSKSEIIAKCDTEDKFIVDGKTYRYKDFQCERMVVSSVLHTNKQCLGSQSETMRVGFTGHDFLEAFQVCYDSNKNIPLYASSSLHFMQSGNEVDPSVFKWKPAPGLGDGEPTGGFTCGASNECCYSKGQLLNVNELPFGPAQVASFTENLNSISIWNPCSDSNRTSWQSFENYLRDTSPTYELWSSWTGASNYVNKNMGLVPRYLWKVMFYDDTTSVMVYVNDESPVDSDIKCSETCKMAESADNVQPVDKFLYCCTVEEFSKAFGVPTDDFVSPF